MSKSLMHILKAKLTLKNIYFNHMRDSKIHLKGIVHHLKKKSFEKNNYPLPLFTIKANRVQNSGPKCFIPRKKKKVIQFGMK